uniref:Uncharacterized protein n=1 Tax=Arundo donax TaxID=35708 RepID=A0A0A9ABU7_ARUDO
MHKMSCSRLCRACSFHVDRDMMSCQCLCRVLYVCVCISYDILIELITILTMLIQVELLFSWR